MPQGLSAGEATSGKGGCVMANRVDHRLKALAAWDRPSETVPVPLAMLDAFLAVIDLGMTSAGHPKIQNEIEYRGVCRHDSDSLRCTTLRALFSGGMRLREAHPAKPAPVQLELSA